MKKVIYLLFAFIALATSASSVHAQKIQTGSVIGRLTGVEDLSSASVVLYIDASGNCIIPQSSEEMLKYSVSPKNTLVVSPTLVATLREALKSGLPVFVVILWEAHYNEQGHQTSLTYTVTSLY